MSLHALKRGFLVTTAVITCLGTAQAQEAAWAVFEAGMEAGRGQEYDQALTLFRRVLAEGQEPDLRTAACYAAADTILKMFEGRRSLSRDLACEGVQHYDCFLHADSGADQAEVARRATWGRSRLIAECAPSTALAWTLTGVSAGVLTGGALLLASNFSDAKSLRGRKAEVEGANGTLDHRINGLNAEGEDIERSTLLSYGVLGAGAFIAVWALLEWSDAGGGASGSANPPGSVLSFRF